MSEPTQRPGTPADFADVETRVRALLAQRRRVRLGDLDDRRAVQAADSLTQAAVAVLLERAPGYNVILTKRTDDVEHHKGEISLAGGAADPEDADSVATALRETHEEIGVAPDHVSVLGKLDELVTVTGFRVTPVVCAVDAGLDLQLHDAEVARVLKVPLQVLRTPESWFTDVREWRGKTYRLRSCRFGDDIIWGATSRILQNFLQVVPPELL